MPRKKPEPKAPPPKAERPQFTGLDLEDDEDEDTTIHDDVVWLQAAKARPQGKQNGKSSS